MRETNWPIKNSLKLRCFNAAKVSRQVALFRRDGRPTSGERLATGGSDSDCLGGMTIGQQYTEPFLSNRVSEWTGGFKMSPVESCGKFSKSDYQGSGCYAERDCGVKTP